MEIIYFNEIDSTQRYLIDEIKSNRISPPIAVIASDQIKGVGSRGNSWEGGRGNLYTSIALKKGNLPDDLPIISTSLYFGWIMRELLYSFDNRVWLKWPNDIYLGDDKIGGIITNKIGDSYIIGIGINLKRGSNSFAYLDIDIEPLELLKKYINKLELTPSWKSIFSKYQLEFENSKRFYTHIGEEVVNMSDVVLCSDGSIIKNGERIFSLR